MVDIRSLMSVDHHHHHHHHQSALRTRLLSSRSNSPHATPGGPISSKPNATPPRARGPRDSACDDGNLPTV